MRKQLLGWTSALALAMGAHSALAEPIPFFDNFDGVGTSLGVSSIVSTGTWQVQGGANVDTLAGAGATFFGVTCRGGSGGCIDLDGSSQPLTGPMVISGSFQLLAGHTYQLGAWISGNQRGGADDEVNLAFLQAPVVGTGAGLSSVVSTGLLAASSPFALYTVTYTAAVDVLASIGFWNSGAGGTASDSFGAILDDVSVKDITAVPLPASAWLLLTGLLALGVVSRRKVAMPFAA